MKIKMQNKLNIYFLILVILPISILFVVLFDFYVKILEEKINSMTKQVLVQTAGSIKIIMDNAVMASNILCMDSQFANGLADAGSRDISQWDQYRSALYVHNQIKDVQNAVLFNYTEAKIYALDLDGTVYSDMSIAKRPADYKKIRESSWFKKTTEKNGFIHWTSLGKDENYLQNSDCVLISQLIIGNQALRNYGMLVIIFPIKIFNNILSGENGSSDHESVTALIDSDYSVLASQGGLYSKDQVSGLDYETITGNSHSISVDNARAGDLFINYEEVPGTGMTIVNIENYSAAMSEVYSLRNNTYIIFVCIFIFMILLTIYLSYNITSPIKKLEKAMLQVKDGIFTTTVDIGGCVEIESLGNSFNMMTGRMDTLIKQVKEETRLHQEARLEALQAQINPHFLINTLNSIRWMANISGNKNVSNMISNLGHILEGSIYNTQEEITLKEELRYLQSYIELQKMRFGNQFDLVVSLSGDLLDCLLPRFILQPIVENSILHGLSNNISGVITITGRRDGEDIFLEVHDNGVGIAEEKISGILQEKNEKRGKLSNIGLSNVHQRIKLNYGDAYGLDIKSGINMGTSVIIKLPFRSEADV